LVCGAARNWGGACNKNLFATKNFGNKFKAQSWNFSQMFWNLKLQHFTLTHSFLFCDKN
jgi:hypothetical protein